MSLGCIGEGARAPGRYLAALELVGEKTEEAEELRDDLDEVKVRGVLPNAHAVSMQR